MKIGIDLGGTNIRVGLVENGSLVRKEVVTCPSKATYEEVLGRLEGLIDRVMCPEVAGIGVGVPSVVDSEEGIVYNVANIPSWTEVPLKRLLQERFSVPVYINNDSNCFALGVKLFGEGRKYRNLVGMTIGTGVGTGIIINGELYSGQNTGAGEIGSLPYLSHDFEHYCSSGFFVRYYNLTGKEAAEKAKKDLSGMVQTQISLPFISAGAAGPLHFESTLTRAQFDAMTKSLVDRTVIPVRQA